MRIPLVLFNAIGIALVPRCAYQTSQSTKPGSMSSQKPSGSTSETDTIEAAHKRASKRLFLQRQRLQELKSAESELSRPKTDYG